MDEIRDFDEIIKGKEDLEEEKKEEIEKTEPEDKDLEEMSEDIELEEKSGTDDQKEEVEDENNPKKEDEKSCDCGCGSENDPDSDWQIDPDEPSKIDEKTFELVENMLANQANAMAKLDDLTKLFERKISVSASQDKIIASMHKELEEYKNDLYFNMIKPILDDIINTRDSILRISRTNIDKGLTEIPIKTLSDYSFDLEEILMKNGVEVFARSEGDEFSPQEAQLVEKVYTNDENLNHKIAKVLSDGYKYNDRILSRQRVNVYFYKEDLENEEENLENKEEILGGKDE
uniref:nucleotide exchange factor GrpE n=1 Tax=Anaerococcus mediterraneensis TaxID=1870984 RepID=UPI00093194E2|nr:nucleotide exchange factor GrpE [Anaerococcus mediterraneensis]